MFDNDINKKAQQFHRELAKKHRMQIISKHRQKLMQNYHIHPLKSGYLQKYWSIPAGKLYQYQDQIFETLDEIHGEELTEQENEELCHDLLYFLMSNSDFVLPYTMKFRKDGSQLTATVVAFAYQCLDTQEGNYWLGYMNNDCKNAIYLNIQCGEDVTKWMEDSVLWDSLILDWGHLQQAQGAIAFLLGEIQIGAYEQFVESVFDKLHQMNKNSQVKHTSTLLILLIRLMIHSQSNPKIFSYLTVILNESILKLYSSDPKIKLDFDFLSMVDMLLDRNKSFCRVIFHEINFQYMLKMIANYYQAKFQGSQGTQAIKGHLSKQKLIKLQSNFLNRVIDVCMNHLRIHRLFKNLISINLNLITIFQPKIQGPINYKYQKLIQFNSSKQKDTEI